VTLACISTGDPVLWSPRTEPGQELHADGQSAVRDLAGQGATDEEMVAAMDKRALWVQVQEAASQGADLKTLKVQKTTKAHVIALCLCFPTLDVVSI